MTQIKWDGTRQKYFSILLEKAAKSDDGSVIVRGFFTSDNKDEVGDIITRAATERAIPKYRQWGNIRYMHLPRPVGKVLRIGIEDGLAWNEVEIKVIDPQAAFEVENGLLTALSVGIFFRFEDIDFLEDGGLIINDYTLAEISLVDHPANYDAVLTGMKGVLAQIAKQDGVDAVRKQIAELQACYADTCEIDASPDANTEKDMEVGDMEENKDLEVQEEIVEEPVAEVDAADKDVTEAEPEVEAAEEDKEAAADEDRPCEDGEDPEEDGCMEEAVPVVEDESEGDDKTMETEVAEEPAEGEKLLTQIGELFAGLSTDIKTLTAALATFGEALKTATEVPQAEERVDGDEQVEEKSVPVEDEEQEEVPGAPMERKGAVPETELPEADDESAKTLTVTDLKSALRQRFLR